MIRIIGSFVSPYVRKVLACMNLKQLAYEVDPITPFYSSSQNPAYNLSSKHQKSPSREYEIRTIRNRHKGRIASSADDLHALLRQMPLRRRGGFINQSVKDCRNADKHAN